MRLTVVGCSGSYPGPDSPASCYLLEASDGERDWRILLDLGNGALGSLHRYADPLSIDAVLISHLHADHCLDLCGYYVMRKYHPAGAQPRIPVYGPDGVADRLARAYDLPSDPGMTEEFDFRGYLDEKDIRIGPFTITPVPVRHPVPAYALRVRVGSKVLTYSGDTALCDGLTRAAREADVFLCEASFLTGEDVPDGVHLTGAEAGRTAAEAGAKRLLLTHIPPWHDPRTPFAEARQTYPGPLVLARPGDRVDV